MTPEEFAELNGAYPDAPNNPTPSTTGFMDNGGFAWAGKMQKKVKGKHILLLICGGKWMMTPLIQEWGMWTIFTIGKQPQKRKSLE